MEYRIRPFAHGGQETVIGIARLLRGRGAVGELEACAPFRLDRRGSEKQRAIEIAGKAGLRQRLVGGRTGESSRSARRSFPPEYQ